MEWAKVFWSGAKTWAATAGVMIFLAVLEVIASAINFTLAGYKPEGLTAEFIWAIILVPIGSGIVKAIGNYTKHRKDPKA